MDALNELYREVILDHYQHPRGKTVLDAASVVTEGKNPLCGDELTLYLGIEQDIVKQVGWQGHGCSICMASTSMLAEQLAGKSLSEAQHLLETVVGMMHGRPALLDIDLGDIEVLEGVKKFPVRIKCALLPWTTLQESLKQVSATKEQGRRSDSGACGPR